MFPFLWYDCFVFTQFFFGVYGNVFYMRSFYIQGCSMFSMYNPEYLVISVCIKTASGAEAALELGDGSHTNLFPICLFENAH